ncbi:MAG: AbrB/MazE/SpoVT family DNA-binding domain-containing protein [Halococcoides sp.]
MSETRKVQLVGGSTYSVSVPKSWAEANDVSAGDPVRVSTDRDGSLSIHSDVAANGGLERITVPLADPRPDNVERTLIVAYLAGYERIRIVADDRFEDRHHRQARSAARDLAGTTVVESDPTAIVVQIALDPAAVSIQQSLDQVASLSRSAVETAFASDHDDVGRVRDRKADIDRLAHLVRRHHDRALVVHGDLDALGIDRWHLALAARAADRSRLIAGEALRAAARFDEWDDPHPTVEPLADALTTALRTLSTPTDPGPLFEHRSRLAEWRAGRDNETAGDPSARAAGILDRIEALVDDIGDLALRSTLQSDREGTPPIDA